MAGTNTYSFQTGGVCKIGATALTNVTQVTVATDGDYEFSPNTVAGDTAAASVRGIDPEIQVTVTVELYDETGVNSDLKTFKKNDSSGKNVTITLQPEGTGAGLPEQAITGMYLKSKQLDLPTGPGKPNASGRMVWEGRMATEPSWGTISA